MPYRKPTRDAAPKPGGAKAMLTHRPNDRIMDKLDLDQRAAVLANKLGEKLLATVNIDSLVGVLVDKYHAEFKHTFTQAMLGRM